MRTLTVSDEDYATIMDALRVAAEDYAYRAEFEEKYRDEPPDEDQMAEHAEYVQAQERYNEVAQRLGEEVQA